MRTIGPDELKLRFPKLESHQYRKTSQATARYNCIAFVKGDERHWWEAGCYGGRFYWPPDVKQLTSVEVLKHIFSLDGYQITENRDAESGWEKIAIYVSLDSDFNHVAISDGRVWKSKLGKGQDIEHYSLDVLEGDQADEYGIVDCIMKRQIK